MVMVMVTAQIEPERVVSRMGAFLWMFSQRSGKAVVVVLLALYASSGNAGEWKAKSNVVFSEIYTDNIKLQESGEDSDFISVIRPGFDVEGKGRRANMSMRAAFEFNDLGGGADALNPRIRGDGSVELLEDFFFLEGDIYSNQSQIDPFGAAGNSSLNKTENTTTTYDYSVSPFVVHRFAQFADLKLRYTFDDQINKSDELSDSTQNSVVLTLNSGPEFGRINWGLTSDYKKTKFDGGGYLNQNADSERYSSSIKVGYRFDRKWQLSGTLGQEWNDYQTYNNEDTDDQFWDVGVLWTPNKRASVDLGYGQHFYSTTPRLKLTYQVRHSVVSVSYSRTLTDTRSERRNADFFANQDVFGDLVDPITGEPLFLTDNVTFRDQGIFTNELFDSSWTLKGRRTSLTLFFKESKQIREDVDGDQTFTTTGIRLSRDLSSKLSATSRITWDERESTAGDQADTSRFYLSLDRQLTPKTSVGLAYSFSDRDSELPSDNYKENRVSVNLSIDF